MIQAFQMIWEVVLHFLENINLVLNHHYENVYDFKAQSDLYLLSKKPKKIKEFIEYSYHEKIAKQNVKKNALIF